MNETPVTWVAPTRRRGISKGLAIGTLGNNKAQTTYIQTIGGPIALRAGFIAMHEPNQQSRQKSTTTNDQELVETLTYASKNRYAYRRQSVQCDPEPQKGKYQQHSQWQNRNLTIRDLTISMGLLLVSLAILSFVIYYLAAKTHPIDIIIAEPAGAQSQTKIYTPQWLTGTSHILLPVVTQDIHGNGHIDITGIETK
jgi:hypothetical protein